MYQGFVGTFFSHLLSLMSSVWAIMIINAHNLRTSELVWLRISFLMAIINSVLGLIRYGSSTHGYKFRNTHILTLNMCTIISFSIIETLLHLKFSSPGNLVYTPLANAIPFACNLFNHNYRTKTNVSDGFIGLNSLIVCVMAYVTENYHAIALNFTYMFGYFIVGDCGFLFDTELPCIDAYQYLQCFINTFTVYAFVH